MRSRMRGRLLVLAASLAAASGLLAGPPSGPQRFVNPTLDGIPVIVENPVDGRAYAAWTFRAGAEYDIAVSVRDATGDWSGPSFFGRFDGVDQRNPALTVDAAGHVYLAYATADSGSILVSALARGSGAWTAPAAVSPEAVRAASPALLVVGDRLVVAFRIGNRVGLAHLSLLSDPIRPLGIQDGPDPVGNNDSDKGPPAGPTPFGGGK